MALLVFSWARVDGVGESDQDERSATARPERRKAGAGRAKSLCRGRGPGFGGWVVTRIARDLGGKYQYIPAFLMAGAWADRLPWNTRLQVPSCMLTSYRTP